VFQFVGVGTVENEIRPLEHAFGVKRLHIQTIQNFSPSHSGVAIGCNPALRKQTKLRSWLPDVSWKLELQDGICIQKPKILLIFLLVWHPKI